MKGETSLPERISKQKMSFTILSGDSTDGDGGFGIGSINLDNMTPLIIDPEENDVFIDMDALHAKSKIEKMVRFKPERTCRTESETLLDCVAYASK